MTDRESAKKHPFKIKCRNCGSKDIAVFAFDDNELSLQCKDCGMSVNCGSYYTKAYDYSISVSGWKERGQCD